MIVVIPALVLILAAAGALWFIGRGQEELAEDLRGSVVQSAQGVVESVRVRQRSLSGAPADIAGTVRWGGETSSFSTGSLVSVGDHVTVVYRIGKSGRTYVEGISRTPGR